MKRTPLKSKGNGLKKKPYVFTFGDNSKLGLNKKPIRGAYKALKKQSAKYIAGKEDRIAHGITIMECFERVMRDRKMYDEYSREYWLCEETGEHLYSINTLNLHHVLLKNKNAYPQYAACDWNIMIVSVESHKFAHSNIDKVPKIKARTEELKQKHINNELWAHQNVL